MDVFGDSFYFIALLDTADNHHRVAHDYARTHRLRVVTTRWVLAEVADALCAPHLREHAAAFIKSLSANRSVLIIEPSDDLFERGLDLYHRRSDKFWSLTDCISFVAMEEQGLREALTGDHHFTQASFVALLGE
jgi:hypothetical protein